MHPESVLPLTVTGIREEAPGVKTFFLQPPAGQSVPYKAGQFLTFLFRHAGGEDRRSYSISSSPGTGEPLAVTVKRVANGRHSRWLIDHAAPGDQLRCTGAAGLFTLPEDMAPYRQVLLFGAGIGITPLFSQLKCLLQSPGPEAVLVYSNRSAADAVFRQELMELQEAHPGRLRIEWLFSDAKNLLRARFSKAMMPALMREYWRAAPEETLCFTCGPFDYMWLVTLLLEEAGIPAAHIRKEIFYNNKPAPRLLPPDQEPHGVTIRLGGTTYSLRVRFPHTILQAAKEAGIALPYSCEAGQCSTCTLRCTSGTVWHSANEVLTARDLAAGKILTCTGHPVGGDVELVDWLIS